MPKTPNPYPKLGHTLNAHINAIRAINHHKEKCFDDTDKPM